jgi:predicted nucleic acid-binding protein
MPGAFAVVDDLEARRCAHAIGVPIRGTLGLVLVARRHGLVPAARPLLEALRRAGLYLSDDLLDRALREVGE